MLLGLPSLVRRRSFFDERDARWRMLNMMNHHRANLLVTEYCPAVINVTDACGCSCVVGGPPYPYCWSAASLCIFIPYIGALYHGRPLFMVGLVTLPTLTHAPMAPLLAMERRWKASSSTPVLWAEAECWICDRLLHRVWTGCGSSLKDSGGCRCRPWCWT